MKRLNRFLANNRTTIFVLAALAAGVLCAVVICYLVLINISSLGTTLSKIMRILSPIIVGLVLAYIIDPIAKFFERKVFVKLSNQKVRRTVSAVIALILVLALLGVFIGTLIPSLVSSITMLIDNADSYYAGVEKVVEKINSLGFGLRIDLSDIVASIKDYLSTFVTDISKNITSILDTTKNIGSTLLNMVIGVILAVYFLFGKQHLLATVTRLRKALLTPETYKVHTRFLKRCHDIFTQYIGCNLIDALIIGVSNAIFMLIIGMPYTPLISFVVGLTNLIPTFGPIIGAVIGAFILVLVKPAYAMWFLIFTVAIQALDAYVIKPRLFSSSFGIPAVWTLISITIGGQLFGIIGVLLAIPVAAVISFVYDESFIPWLQKKNKARSGAAKDAEIDPSSEEEDNKEQ